MIRMVEVWEGSWIPLFKWQIRIADWIEICTFQKLYQKLEYWLSLILEFKPTGLIHSMSSMPTSKPNISTSKLNIWRILLFSATQWGKKDLFCTHVKVYCFWRFRSEYQQFSLGRQMSRSGFSCLFLERARPHMVLPVSLWSFMSPFQW